MAASPKPPALGGRRRGAPTFRAAGGSPRQHNEEMYKKVSTNSAQQSDATSR